MRFVQIFLLPVLLTPALAAPPARESGACSLETAEPQSVAIVDENLELLLDDGRKASLAGLDFPADSALKSAARKRLDDWLAGAQVFVAPLAAGQDRWGRIPAAIFAAESPAADAPIVSVSAVMIEEGHARMRPDAAAEGCAAAHLSAETKAREGARGLWRDSRFAARDANAPGFGGGAEPLKGMVVASGVIRSTGESARAIYLNFGARRGDFAAVISRRNLDIFNASRISPRMLVGRRARVRGLIETTFGPRMELLSPQALELLDDAGAP